MDLSIIIVNWNTQDLLRACLRSVVDSLENAGLNDMGLNNADPNNPSAASRSNPRDLNAELWVVDNGSGDGSAEMVAREFPHVHLIVNSDNKGFSAANNQALGCARGRHVLLLNSDTIVHGDVLAQCVAYLDAHTDVGALGCRVLNGDGSTQVMGTQFPTLLNLTLQTLGLSKLPWAFFDRYRMTKWDRKSERDVDVISGCFLMTRRQVIDQIGPLDEAFFFFSEETDWCFAMAQAGWRRVVAPVGEITHFGGGSTGALNHRRNLLLSEGLVRFQCKNFGLLNGMTMWCLLLLHNASRGVGYGLLAVLGRWWPQNSTQTQKRAQIQIRAQAQKRAAVFFKVVWGFSAAWPKGR
jgi:GT2 family glycosyltransferase